jgi:hypothetical protein
MSEDMRERLAEALGHMRIRALVPEHGCGGDESECYRLCPIPVEVDETTVLDALLPLIAEAEANARAEGRREAVEVIRDGLRRGYQRNDIDGPASWWVQLRYVLVLLDQALDGGDS